MTDLGGGRVEKKAKQIATNTYDYVRGMQNVILNDYTFSKKKR